MNSLRAHCRETPLANVLTRASCPPMPPSEGYSGLEFVMKGTYFQITVSDTAQWLEFVQEILRQELLRPEGTVLLVDCAFQLGDMHKPNTFLHRVYTNLQRSCPEEADLDKLFKERIVLWNSFENLQAINEKLGSLEGLPRGSPLDYVIVSNLSIFYWEMRAEHDFEDLKRFDVLATEISSRYDCNIFSSMSNVR